jgi:taurine transport system permease protein
MSGRSLSLGSLSFGCLFLLWFGLTGFGFWKPLTDPLFLPSPFTVARTFVDLLVNGYQGRSLSFHVMMSLFRFGVALVVCIVVAIPLGLLMGMWETVKALVDPPIEIIRPIPKLALLPLLIIWFGIGEMAKILVIVLAIFPIMSISAMQAVRSVSKRKVQAAYSLGASNRTVFCRVLLPASLPGIFTGIRVSIGVGVTMLVGAEMIATSNGIAWMALAASDFLLSNVVLVAVGIMALMGFILDQIARGVENWFVHWSGKEG